MSARPVEMAERLAELRLPNQIPPEVSAMVLWCLAKEPARRPQNARAAAAAVGISMPNADRAAPPTVPSAPNLWRSHWWKNK